MWEYVMFWLAREVSDLIVFLIIVGGGLLGFSLLWIVAKIHHKISRHRRDNKENQE